MRKIFLVIKFVFDRIFAVFLLPIAVPVGLVIAVAIKMDSPGPVFFCQQRSGLREKPFKIFKFRTMVVGASLSGPVISLKDCRVTRVGRFLRLSSLDELPQLFNILIGDMSFVGPRAILQESIKSNEKRRQNFRPGITGLAAVRGRQSLSWAQRMQMDLWYVDHWSLPLDLRIMVQTIPVVLLAQNVYDRDGEMKARK